MALRMFIVSFSPKSIKLLDVDLINLINCLEKEKSFLIRY